MSALNSTEGDPPRQKQIDKKLSGRKKERVPQSARSKHQRPRPICKVCGRSFSKPANLRAHERIHTGEKRYCCLICHRRFVWKSSLNFHSRTAHRDSNVHKENAQQTVVVPQPLEEGKVFLQGSLCSSFVIENEVPTMANATNAVELEEHNTRIESDKDAGHADSLTKDFMKPEEPFNLLGSWEDDYISLLGIWGDPVTHHDFNVYLPSELGMDAYFPIPPLTDTSAPEDAHDEIISI